MKHAAIKLALHSQNPFGAIMTDSNLGFKKDVFMTMDRHQSPTQKTDDALN